MSRQIAMFIHVLTIMVQFANASGLMVPTKYRALFALVLSGAQGALGWLQHNFNPDGTPASVAYKPQ